MSHSTKSAANLGQAEVMRSQLGRVRGLGAAHAGVHHWWLERITSLALVPLSLWFVAAVLILKDSPYPVVAHWAARPVNTVLLVSLVILTYWHMQLGLQVVIEDYVHDDRFKLPYLLLLRAGCFLFGVWGVIAALRLAFHG